MTNKNQQDASSKPDPYAPHELRFRSMIQVIDKPGTLISVAGNCAPMTLAREAMGIDWTTRAELVEAIPPAYSEFIARQISDFH